MKTLLISLEQSGQGPTRVRMAFYDERNCELKDEWQAENEWIPVDSIISGMWYKFTENQKPTTYEK